MIGKRTGTKGCRVRKRVRWESRLVSWTSGLLITMYDIGLLIAMYDIVVSCRRHLLIAEFRGGR